MASAVNFYEDIKANPNKFMQLRCRDLLFAYYSCPQVDLKKEFFSQHNFISYTFSGEKRIHKGNKNWYLESDVAIFARKGAYLFEKFEKVEHCVMVFFMPDTYLCEVIRQHRNQLQLYTKNGGPRESIVKLDLTAATKAFFQSMIAYFREPPMENILELKFRELLLNLASNPANHALLSILNGLHPSEKPSLRDIMEDNYLYNLTLEDFAKISLRSLPTFKREFQSVFQTTPGKWLLQRRLDHANMLLRSTGGSVSEIALESGFENTSHFSRVFKERYGKSPFHFRKEATTP